MKITSVIARFLLGLIFLVFGLNGFFHFIPMPPPPAWPVNSWEHFSSHSTWSSSSPSS